MTITISENVAPSTLERILNYIKREKVPYAVVPNSDEEEADVQRTDAIRERLREKFVTTSEWATMDDDDRIDASLFEGMMYDQEKGNIEYYSEEDTRVFYKNHKKQIHAI
jgi:ABC-type Zn uptake system ZnuABC Zn-binding protein ZnuA